MSNKVQFIAHNIDTRPKNQTYLGKSNSKEDINERIKLVEKTLEQAREKTESDSKVLKILMMPEFFFRGQEGAYSMENVQLIIEDLQNLVMDEKKWKNWIFVFGSILGASFVPKENKTEIYNYVLVQEGGFGNKEDAGPNAARIVLKEYKSTIDFINSGSGFVSNNVKYLERLEKGSEDKVWNYDGNSVFDIDGIQFGLEICLDHKKQRLEKSTDLPKIDIQLIPSGGMTIQRNAIVSKEGGYVFHCDGNGYGSTLLKVSKNTPHYNISSTYDVDVDSAGIRIGEIYRQDAGKLHIYPPQDLNTRKNSETLRKRKTPDSQLSESGKSQKRPKESKVTKA